MTQETNSKIKVSPAELESRTIELSSSAFEMFCNDIGSMLGCDVGTTKKSTATLSLADLKKQFEKLVAVTSVRATGALNGSFYFVFDQEAFFTLAGTLVMLPEQIINQNRKQGNLQAAAVMGDAVGEIGNLMVGSWDRVFRTELEGHGHFALSKNFVGSPWNNPEENIELTMASQLQTVSFEITVKDFAPAVCAIIYPKDLFEGKRSEPDIETLNKQTAEADELVPNAATKEMASETETNSGKDSVQAASEPVQEESTDQSQLPESANQKNLEETCQVSESIRKMTASPAVLPGEFAQALNAKSAENIMRKDFVWASPDQTVEYAFGLMKENNTDFVLVGQNGTLEGIVSKSDIRGAMSPYLQERFAQWRTPLDTATLQIRLKWVMSKPAVGITPDAPLTAIAKQMNKEKIKMLPVINSKGSVMGIVTVFELFSVFSNLS
jgi:CBS domain-containing protein